MCALFFPFHILFATMGACSFSDFLRPVWIKGNLVGYSKEVNASIQATPNRFAAVVVGAGSGKR